MFVAATALVVFVLYRREFHSSALSTLMSSSPAMRPRYREALN